MDRIRRGAWPLLLALTVGNWMFGCGQILIFPAPGLHLQASLDHVIQSNWSPTTCSLLAQLGLEQVAKNHPREAFANLECTIHNRRNDAQSFLALAELAEQISWTTEVTTRGDGIRWSRDAAVYAMFCLKALGKDHVQDGISCEPIKLHNRAVMRCLHLAQTRQPASHNNWPTKLTNAGIALSSPVASWTALGFELLRPTTEFFVVEPGLSGRRGGLGVPLVAHRRLEDSELDTWKPYGPRNVVFAATAVIHPNGCAVNWRQEPVELVLHDPLHDNGINVGDSPLPMGADVIIPLAFRLAQYPLRNYEFLGVLDPEFYMARAGVYALDPYQPGKIPVVLIHGVWSSPKVWAPMLATLRADPALRSISVLGRALPLWLRTSACGLLRAPVAARNPPKI